MELKVIYTVSELAALAGLSRFRTLRLLESARVPIKRSGRLLVVYLAELRSACPAFWDGVLDRAQGAQREASASDDERD